MSHENTPPLRGAKHTRPLSKRSVPAGPQGRTCNLSRKKVRKHLFLLPRPAALSRETRLCESRPRWQRPRAEEIAAPGPHRPLPPRPPRQVPALMGGRALAETSPSAYPGAPGRARAGPPAAGVPAAAAAARPGTRRSGDPARAWSLSRPGSTRLPRRPHRARAPRAGPCASSPPAQLPLGPGASPPAEPWGRFTHPGRRLAPHRAREPSLRRPGPHRASPAMAPAPGGGSAGRRHLLARPAAPGRAPGGGFTRAGAGAGAAWSRGGSAPGFPRCGRRAPGREDGTDAARGAPLPGSAYGLRGRGFEERGLAAAGRTRDPPSHRPRRPLRPALLALWLVQARVGLRPPGGRRYCSSERRFIDKEST